MSEQFDDVVMVLLGGCRNEGDWQRVEELKRLVHDLELDNHVVFEVNVGINVNDE